MTESMGVSPITSLFLLRRQESGVQTEVVVSKRSSTIVSVFLQRLDCLRKVPTVSRTCISISTYEVIRASRANHVLLYKQYSTNDSFAWIKKTSRDEANPTTRRRPRKGVRFGGAVDPCFVCCASSRSASSHAGTHTTLLMTASNILDH